MLTPLSVLRTHLIASARRRKERPAKRCSALAWHWGCCVCAARQQSCYLVLRAVTRQSDADRHRMDRINRECGQRKGFQALGGGWGRQIIDPFTFIYNRQDAQQCVYATDPCSVRVCVLQPAWQRGMSYIPCLASTKQRLWSLHSRQSFPCWAESGRLGTGE